jgi:hypothetical protein
MLEIMVFLCKKIHFSTQKEGFIWNVLLSDVYSTNFAIKNERENIGWHDLS